MPMIFDVLSSRARSAEATALDTIAAAARTVAAGGTANVRVGCRHALPRPARRCPGPRRGGGAVGRATGERTQARRLHQQQPAVGSMRFPSPGSSTYYEGIVSCLIGLSRGGSSACSAYRSRGRWWLHRRLPDHHRDRFRRSTPVRPVA